MSAGSCPPCRAGADLFQTQADPPSAPPELAGLTERECEILDLLAAGAGNDAIARTLSVSKQDGAQHGLRDLREAARQRFLRVVDVGGDLGLRE